MSEKIELNQSPENVAPEASDGATANRRPPKKRPQSAPGEGMPGLAAGPGVAGSAAPTSDLPVAPGHPPQAPEPPVAEFRGLDQVELPPKSEAEVRQITKASELVDERSMLDATVKEMAAKLRDLRRQHRKTLADVETQNRIVTATGIAEAVPGDMRQRGFNDDRIKRLLTLIARTKLTPDEVAALIAPYMGK
ncbi:MAG: hypothetical protein IBJ15_16410 [Alphaproteobacteria bacterium]|nr:hypothetical protein [Alphaproteobacteria bacterium]